MQPEIRLIDAVRQAYAVTQEATGLSRGNHCFFTGYLAERLMHAGFLTNEEANEFAAMLVAFDKEVNLNA